VQWALEEVEEPAAVAGAAGGEWEGQKPRVQEVAACAQTAAIK